MSFLAVGKRSIRRSAGRPRRQARQDQGVECLMLSTTAGGVLVHVAVRRI